LVQGSGRQFQKVILHDASLQKAHLWPHVQMLEIFSAYNNEKVVISDIPPVAECSNELCASLEAIKDGIYASKCESNMREFPITHSVVSSNYPPPSLAFSNDGTMEIYFRREMDTHRSMAFHLWMLNAGARRCQGRRN